MSFIIEHTRLGFCWWDIPALIILLVVVVVFIWKCHEMKKREKELEDKIAELYADDTTPLENEN